jgi:hypothetical protein
VPRANHLLSPADQAANKTSMVVFSPDEAGRPRQALRLASER